MDLQLTGKRALVTGSSAGIGECIPRVLAREGASVMVTGRDAARASKVADDINSAGFGHAAAIVGDPGTDEGAARVADGSLAALGGIDILVNNAGTYSNSRWLEGEPEEWGRVYNTNAVSMVRMIQRLVPPMKALGWGRVIQIASVDAIQPFAQMPDYSATKAANIAMTMSLAKELGGTGVTVNTVSPGIVINGQIKAMFAGVAEERGWGGEWPEIERKMLSEWMPTLVGRYGTGDDVANLVAYVASPLAGYIDAANLRVDGGSFL